MGEDSAQHPEFPFFRSILPSERPFFDKYAKMEHLYSDFNFTSIYVWDLNGSHQYSVHNGNVVLQLDHYVTGEPILSILGTHDVDGTIDNVLDYSRKEFGNDHLQLVPEQTIKSINDVAKYDIQEDRPNFDYIYSLKALSELSGNTYKSKRHAANRCMREFDIIFEELDQITSATRMAIIDMLEKWVVEKVKNGKEYEDSESELRSLQRVFDDFNNNPYIKLSTARNKGILVGFSIDEFIDNGYVLSHYCKTVPNITGLTEYLNRELAASFLKKGYTYWNWEQDTGNKKLERLKLSYRPVHFNKKYMLSRPTH